MKTFKKLFSVSAIVALLGTLMPIYAFGANYTTELVQAYDYAHDHGITTMSSIDNADMYGNLTRIAMAKMLANYAIDVLGLTPDTTKECTFPDVTAALDAQYDNGVTKACQLGLMGVGIKNFNPNGIVTRAEFGTAFSRALNANDADKLAEMNKADPYYKDHLNFLKEEGIMNNISDPNMVEVRGYVMLMMMRSDDTYTPTEGCSAEELLKCLTADDYDACVAACSEEGAQVDEPEEVKAGTLTVSMGDALADGTQIPNAGIVSFGTVKFAASSDDVNLKSVTIKKQGLVKNMANTKVWFEENGSRVSAKVSFNSDGEAIVSFAPAYTVKAGKTAKFDLYVDLTNAGLGAGTDLSFASIDVDSSAETNKGSFSTPTLRTANYTVASVEISDNSATWAVPPTCSTGGWTTETACKANGKTWTAGTLAASATEESSATSNGYEVANFTITNTSNTEDVTFNSITLKQEGTADLKNLSDIVLERNGEIVSKGYSIDGKYLTINVKNDKIEKGNNALYTVRAAVNAIDRSTDTYKFYLKNAEELNVVESTTNFRASIAELAIAYIPYTNVNTKAYTIKGGDVTFARDESLDLDQTVSAGSEVVLMQGTITTKESVTFENPVLTINTLTSTTPALSDLFTTLYLKIGNSVFTYTAGAEKAGDTLKLDGTAVVNGKVNVKVYGTLKNTVVGNNSIKLNSLNLASFAKTNTNNGAAYYSNNEVDVASAIGSIAGNTVTVESSALTMTRTDGLGASANVPTGNGTKVYGAKVSTQSKNGAKITSISFGITPGAISQDYTLTLYVDGKAVSTKTVAKAATTVTFNGFNFTVDADTDATVEVKADLKEGTTATNWQLTAGTVTFVNLASNKTDTTASIAGAKVTIVTPNGTVSIDTDAVDAKLLGKGEKDVELAAIKVASTNGNVKLYNLKLTVTNGVNLNNVRLVDSEGNDIATANSATDTAITFTNLSKTSLVEKDNTVTYKLVADITDNITAGNVTVSLATAADADLRSSNGETLLAKASTTATSNTHSVNAASVVIAQTSATQGTSVKQALTFTVTANGADVTLASVENTLSAAGYKHICTAAEAGVRAGCTAAGDEAAINATDLVVYRGNLNKVVTLGGANAKVEKGTTATFIIGFPNIAVSSTATNYSWDLTVTDFTFDVIAGGVKNYTNVATLPFTASK